MLGRFSPERVSRGHGLVQCWGIWDLPGKARTVQALREDLGSVSAAVLLPGSQELLLGSP